MAAPSTLPPSRLPSLANPTRVCRRRPTHPDVEPRFALPLHLDALVDLVVRDAAAAAAAGDAAPLLGRRAQRLGAVEDRGGVGAVAV